MVDPMGLSAAATLDRLCTRVPHPWVRAGGHLIRALAAANAVDNALGQRERATTANSGSADRSACRHRCVYVIRPVFV